MLAVSRSIARELRIGERAITDDRIRSMPPRLRAAFETREPVQLQLPGFER